MPSSTTERRTPRWVRWLIILLGVGLALRALLPLVTEWGIEALGGRVVATTVQVENVDFALLAGAVTIDGLRMATEGDPATVPLLEVRRIHVNLGTTSLLLGRILIEDVRVEGVAINPERRSDGRFVNPILVELVLPETVPSIQVDRAVVADLSVGLVDPYEDDSLLQVGLREFQITGLRAADRSLAVETIQTDGLRIGLDRALVDGPRSLPAAYAPPETSDATSSPASAQSASPQPASPVTLSAAEDHSSNSSGSETTPFDARVSHVLIRDTGFDWVDRSLAERLEETDEGLTLEAHNLVLSERGLSQLRVDGQGLRGEPFVISGSSDANGITVTFESEPMHLNPFDPYSRELAGFEIESGRVSLKSQLQLTGTQIASEHAVTLYDVQVHGDTFFKNVIGGGVSMILGLLSDDDGVLQLTFPVDHNLENESQDDLWNTVKAVLRSALSEPLADAGGTIGRDGEIRFEPFPSRTGSTQILEGEEDRIAYLGDLLVRRERMHLVLTGRGDEPEGVVLPRSAEMAGSTRRTSRRVTLARARARALQALFVEGQGVPSGQVRLAKTTLNGDPGVEIRLEVGDPG